MNDPARTRTAYHEAGHAVLTHYLGLGLQSVSIISDHESAGHSIDGGEYSEDAEDLRLLAGEAFWLRIAVARYAGAEAVRMLAPRSRWRDGADNDYRWAAIALEKITSDLESLRALQRLAMRRARVLVEHYWPEIDALAPTLIDGGTLDGEKASTIISRTHRDRKGTLMLF